MTHGCLYVGILEGFANGHKGHAYSRISIKQMKNEGAQFKEWEHEWKTLSIALKGTPAAEDDIRL